MTLTLTRKTLAAIIATIVLLFANAAMARVIFVDNRAPAPGQGTQQSPFATLAMGASGSGFGDVIYVAESGAPYTDSVVLKKGQLLIGSAFGLNALRTDFHVEPGADVPAMHGPGPEIRGTITTNGDNVIAGCTIVAERLPGIIGVGAFGALTVRDVFFKPSLGGFAIYLQEHHGKVTITGGAIDAAQQGSGLGIAGGEGEIVVERCAFSGEFTTALRIIGHRLGAITFRRGTKFRVADASDDALVLRDIEKSSPVVFDDVVTVRGRRRGFVAGNVGKVTLGGTSTLSTTNAAALDVRDSGVELSFESVSAQGVAPGQLDEGIVIDRVHGHVTITGIDGKIGSGGAILHARSNGIRIAQTSNIRIAGVTLTDSGVNMPAKGVRCAGGFDVSSTAVCRAALYLRHLTDSTFENIVVDGGGAMGINANNLRNVAFSGLDVHHSGDETFESGVLLQEIGGTITFTASSFADNAGSEMLVEQRFNDGHLVLDRCKLAAPVRPEVAKQLIEVEALGAGKLSIDIRYSDLRDSIGSAIDVSSGENGSLALSVVDTTLQHFGRGVIDAVAKDASRLMLTVRGSQFAAPAVREHAWVDVGGQMRATVCAEISANHFTAPEGVAVHVSAGSSASVRVIGVAAAADAKAVTAALTAANNGAFVVIDGPVNGQLTCN
ncbi:MAG: hypothetical protein QOK37_3187 [Thermoanaerobaculia bacterium]|jgi:hypothetical protein|nr:hypothetical protein [Thermoanaerobaculia bacterium]